MRKLLFIVGATATGKTSLALNIAKKFNGELISADSRQVYRGMNIGTGKDIPKSFEFRNSNFEFGGKKIPFYGNGPKIWGYDLVEPDEEFSVAFFLRVARIVCQDIWKRGKLPIVVGGTGLYISALEKPMPTMSIQPNTRLRKQLEMASIRKLQQNLKQTDPIHYAEMNDSDRKNPRRLVRAIEIAKYLLAHPEMKKKATPTVVGRNISTLRIGLKAPKHLLYKRIDESVNRRIEQGAEKEIRSLMSRGYGFDLPAFSALGYRQWKSFFAGVATKRQAINRWLLDEHAYARRQLTWFKKQPGIQWYDISRRDFNKAVVQEAEQWYSDA